MLAIDLVLRLVLLTFAGLAIAVLSTVLLKYSLGRVSIAGAFVALTLLAAVEAREKIRADRELAEQLEFESMVRERHEAEVNWRSKIVFWEVMELIDLLKPQKENQ